MSFHHHPPTDRFVTPPAGPEIVLDDGRSASECLSTISPDSISPGSVRGHMATPPRSPARYAGGPALLPRIRRQDQTLDPVVEPRHHRRNLSSVTSTGFPVGYDPNNYVAGSFRRSITPPEKQGLLAAPLATPDSIRDSGRLHPSSMTHSRSTSVSSVDESALARFAYPTYRQAPNCLPVATASKARSSSFSNLPVLAPNTQQAAPRQGSLPAELMFENYAEPPPQTTLIDYLTAPNPEPVLVRRVTDPSRIHDLHFWWDVRNLRSWTNFNLQTIRAIPGFDRLLEIALPASALPLPRATNLVPETLAHLQETYSEFYATKINAALKVALGNGRPTLRANKPQPGGRAQQPDFVSAYECDYDKTIWGEGRGRVVGLVRSFEQWNSGMRSSSGTSDQVDYLRELAHLHRCMREHECRYGFIATEVELVCVRAGVESIPVFGLLELSQPIRVHRGREDGMTVALALWYLHMLAKNEPLPGQPHWRLDVGAPQVLTRQRCLERDSWMKLRPENKERRTAKQNRGWVMPEEPFNQRKETVKHKRAKRT